MCGEVDAAQATPMFAQYLQIKEQYPDCILFYRLGDFYETFMEDAELVARELELVLTGRDAGKGLGRVPMAGIPYHAAEGYIARLIDKGYKVAICDQLEDPKLARGLVKRDVTRVVTPGTLVEPRLLPEKANNFLAAVAWSKAGFGLAVVDLSTGEFAAAQLNGADSLRQLLEEIGRLEPREVILEPGLASEPSVTGPLKNAGIAVSPFDGRHFNHQAAYRRLTQHFGTSSLAGFGCEHLELATRAAGAALAYLAEMHRSSLSHVSGLAVYYPGDYMVLDPATRRNLELTRSLRDGGRRGTLLWVVDRTVTAMGARMLKGWLERPLLDLAQIQARHAAVAELVNKPVLRADLRAMLQDVHDLERLAGRVAVGTANARDLVALKASLVALPSIRVVMEEVTAPRLVELRDRLDMLDDVRDLIEQAIADEPPVALTEGGLLKDGFHPEVDELRRIARDGKAWIAQVEARERERTGIKSLKIGYNKVFGYYLSVTRANLALVPADYIRKQTLANEERFITPELKELEEKVLHAGERLMSLEYELFLEIRQQVAAEITRIQRSARAVAELDALASFAEVASLYGYCQPLMDRSTVLELRGARHPVLERVMPEGTFVPNDLLVDTAENRLLLITGPNMGGKSTVMRQAALAVILAQAGSFVPAEAAHIGLVDRVFTRVGASDDLATGQSTFMVEMTEVANILHAATERSLVVLDEVGRGTATFDGLSIAWAITEHIHQHIGCRTLFATHYHELCELEGLLPGVKNYSVAVMEKGEEIIFLRKLVRGGADRSYGIQVGRLAGLPSTVVERAREILATLEQQEGERKSRREAAAQKLRRQPPVQLTFFEPKKDPVVEELLGLNVMALTPIEALNVLYQLQAKAKESR
ncbi:DNA mismatch repair protein MutS [Symbiobacterium terraclitae]|uniref:DNA mismatch repair protein MutS n=1 Tax=Symbiobacterium terraclitae TaxID=557451 RepID=UPI001AEB5595|nr:DNA mismatch repair protein MutS [Symbiobacterium terraclitae]